VSRDARPRSLADVVMPRRPAGIPDAEGDDHDALALLEANGFAVTPEGLTDALDTDLEIFQAAAARTLGALGARPALAPLERLACDPDVSETVRVQAAYALARMGVADACEILARELAGSPEASPAPLQAAGALARLGDPRGFEVVRAALDSPNRVTAMIAVKQLSAFVGLGGPDLEGAFAAALARPEPPIGGEARAQLTALGTEWARRLLAEYPPPPRG